MSYTDILDDPCKINEIDKSGMLSFCTNASKHYAKAAALAGRFQTTFSNPRAIIVSGMGGSAIGGELLKDWSRDKLTVPVEVCREYSLPEYADKDTLVVAVSYSGETEETLNTFMDALKRKCMIACITSGGKLADLAAKMSLPMLIIPSGMPPRAGLPYLFLPLLVMLEKMDQVKGVTSEVLETTEILKKVSEENNPERPSRSNFSKTLASGISEVIPVVYGFGFFRAVAQRFKTQFNENSKIPSKWDCFSELNHNEIVGWENPQKLARCFKAIFIRDRNDPPEMRERIEFTKELLCSKSIETFEVQSKGTSTLARMASAICVGDFASVYLAILRGVDPTPVKTISLLKERIERSGIKAKAVRELERIASS